MPGKCWQQSLAPDVREWTASELARAMRASGEPCIDGGRVADMRSKTSLRRFRRLRTCCGSAEWVAEFRGRRYLFGFNYGH